MKDVFDLMFLDDEDLPDEFNDEELDEILDEEELEDDDDIKYPIWKNGTLNRDVPKGFNYALGYADNIGIRTKPVNSPLHITRINGSIGDKTDD